MGLMIYLIIVILFVVLILWTWNSVKDYENTVAKVGYIILGLLLNLIIVSVIFHFSKVDINYPNANIMKNVRKFILLTFTPLNGLVTMPMIANILSKIKDGENQKKRICILSLIFIVVIIFEVFYFKNIQTGILNIMKL